MKSTKTTIKNQLSLKNFYAVIAKGFLLSTLILGAASATLAQSAFMGDYDRRFAAPSGYRVDPENPDPATPGAVSQSYYAAGDIMPDGSIIAAGRLFGQRWELIFRKFTPQGTLDGTFGTNGLVRNQEFYVIDTNPRTGLRSGGAGNLNPSTMPDWGVRASDFIPYKIKALPSNQFLVIGVCEMDGVARFPSNGGTLPSPIVGKGICMMRFQADGTLDTTFGTAGEFSAGGSGVQGFLYREAPGMVFTPIGSQPGTNYTAEIENLDAVIQTDGKILIAGTSRVRFQIGSAEQIVAGFLVRFTGQGARDAAFGESGASHHSAAPQQPNNCTPRTRFFGVAVQPDGRILTMGSSGTVDQADCINAHGNRFYVVRWLANGQPETQRHLDGNTVYNNQRERANSAVFTKNGKVIVSGSYNCQPTMARLNLADLSLDTTFGANGRRSYGNGFCGISTAPYASSLYLKAVQKDGRMIGLDDHSNHRTVRFNPDGSPDQSFGNQSIEGAPGGRGRLAVDVAHYNGAVNPLEAAELLVRPNGRISLLGKSFAHAGLGIQRAVVSQQSTVLKNGVYTDFNNDGKAEIAVFRPSDGVWHQLDSRTGAHSNLPWGLSADRPAPADYDGDGRTDTAVYRDGTWYILQSANGQIRYAYFGAAGDLPRPGDFDGDGLADISVFRPSSGAWYRINSADNSFSVVQFGASGDVPMLGDYDADGKTDFTVFRPSNATWYTFRSSDNQVRIDVFGAAGDIPLSGDFDGDSRADLAVFRPSDRTWYIARPEGVPAHSFDAIPFGVSTDLPAPSDYDNDGRTDVAVYRHGVWWINRSGSSDVTSVLFGLSTDEPVAAAYLP